MKVAPTFKRLFNYSLFTVILLTSVTDTMAQERHESDLKDFKITIEMTDKGLKMQSSEGSAWLDLAFSLDYNRPQAIDEFGMTSLDKVPFDTDEKLADYLFTIARTKDEISLVGIKGTAWKELRFHLADNGKQSINQFGMAD
ncbi:hypothetical protein SAMN04488057_106165 [Cyclobacterium lianum]|uniref:Uncharacterized protein n=1 Tax=Cyclobacterium lianum TaxID=388280 RepID=A0A1M7NY61_9BACT|nr:hypothetical protein [Cyclobacterium lianum]SHN09048.1 hypothetical protein SAMN04488057_106165 [Cyclobacterium lianum]